LNFFAHKLIKDLLLSSTWIFCTSLPKHVEHT
jgi:hypothetical protein